MKSSFPILMNDSFYNFRHYPRIDKHRLNINPKIAYITISTIGCAKFLTCYKFCLWVTDKIGSNNTSTVSRPFTINSARIFQSWQEPHRSIHSFLTRLFLMDFYLFPLSRYHTHTIHIPYTFTVSEEVKAEYVCSRRRRYRDK